MKGYELNYYSFLGFVYTKGLDGDIESSARGYVFGDLGGSYYYVDYYQFGHDRVDDLSLCESVTVWEINDRKIIADIEEYY